MKEQEIIDYLKNEGEVFDFYARADLNKISANQYVLINYDNDFFKLVEVILKKREETVIDSKGKEQKSKVEYIEEYKTIKTYDLKNINSVEIDKLALSRLYNFNNGDIIRLNEKATVFEEYLRSKNVSANTKQRKWYRKIIGFRSGTPWKMIVASLFLLGLIALIVDAAIETEGEKEEKIVQETKKQEEEKSALAEIKKRDEEKAKAKEKEKEREKEDALVEKEKYKKEYKENVGPTFDMQIKRIDDDWDELWVATFDGVSKGEIDNFSAYSNMTILEGKYEGLSQSIKNMPVPHYFDKKDKATFQNYQLNFENMLSTRIDGIKHAKDIFDKNSVSPSDIEKISDTGRLSQSFMIDGIASIVELNTKYGYERAEN